MSFVLFALIGTLAYSHEYRSWLTLVLMAAVLFILFYAFRVIANKEVVLLAMILAFTLFAITYFIVLRKDIFVLSNFGRMGEPFEHPNTLSAYMVIASMLTMYSVFFFEKNIKFVLLFPLAMFIIIGLTTGSRAFIIFVFIILIALSIFRFKKNKWVLLGILAGILILFVLLLTLPMLENLRFRLFNGIATVFGTSSQPDNSVLQRSTWFSYGFTLGGQKFLTGYGVGGFANTSGVLTYSHSNLSEVVCNFGVIGAILFYLPIGWLGYSNIKKYTKYSPLVFVPLSPTIVKYPFSVVNDSTAAAFLSHASFYSCLFLRDYYKNHYLASCISIYIRFAASSFLALTQPTSRKDYS